MLTGLEGVDSAVVTLRCVTLREMLRSLGAFPVHSFRHYIRSKGAVATPIRNGRLSARHLQRDRTAVKDKRSPKGLYVARYYRLFEQQKTGR